MRTKNYRYFAITILTVVGLYLFIPTTRGEANDANFMDANALSAISAMDINSIDWPIRFPSANVNVQGSVPLALIHKIAIKKAVEKWGQVAEGPSLVCCDDDGDVVAYMFPFVINRSSFPTYTEMVSSVKRGRKIAEEGLTAMTEDEQQEVLDFVIGQARQREGASGDNNEPPNLNVPENPDADNSVLDMVAKKLGRQKSIGSGKFGTVIVSARYDRFPVPLYMHYLPPYYYQGDLAASRVEEILSSTGATLERIYFLGRGRGQYFEFIVSDKRVLLDSYDLTEKFPDNVLTRKGRKVTPEPEIASLIAEAWANIEKEVK